MQFLKICATLNLTYLLAMYYIDGWSSILSFQRTLLIDPLLSYSIYCLAKTSYQESTASFQRLPRVFLHKVILHRYFSALLLQFSFIFGALLFFGYLVSANGPIPSTTNTFV